MPTPCTADPCAKHQRCHCDCPCGIGDDCDDCDGLSDPEQRQRYAERLAHYDHVHVAVFGPTDSAAGPTRHDPEGPAAHPS